MEKKVCPLLTAIGPINKDGRKPGWSCLEGRCAWWTNLKDVNGQEHGMCAIAALVCVKVV